MTSPPTVNEGRLDLVTDIPSYRSALREHLARDEFSRWRDVYYSSVEERVADHAVLVNVLYGQGWNRFGWPASVGGSGGDARHRAVLFDELTNARLPVPDQHVVLETLGPALIHFSPALAERVVPPALSGAEWWGQGFSEPEAGSDLASLRCRARRDSDRYVLNGQKIWTSNGATARRLMCLVRTGTPESRHKGISMVLVDSDAPGVTVRPIALASGENELAEVFFDDAIVASDRLVGPEHGGWGVAMYIMQYERAMYAWIRSAVMLRKFRELVNWLRQTDAPPADGLRRRLGDCYTDIVTLRARSAETVRTLAAGEVVGPTASVDKVLLATAELSLHDLGRDVLGPDFMYTDEPVPAQWRADWWYSRSATILGGSSEMQRTILADHVLHLPKEPK